MEQVSPGTTRIQHYAWYTYLWRMPRHPRQAGREMVEWNSAWPGLAVVLALGLYLAFSCYRSYLNGDYPPPPEELRVWIETWGEFSMLPLPWLGIPLEQYRLFMSIISLPVALGSWLVMACLARLLSRWFGGSVSFRQYLNLLAFSFFPFWFLSAVGDGLFSAGLREHLLPALLGDYGPVVQAMFKYYPPLLYTCLFGLGAVCSGLAAFGASRFGKQLQVWQAVLIGWLTLLPPLMLVSLLYR
jgi:hypothetical protein